jgi:GH43 family beta-xylosidase
MQPVWSGYFADPHVIRTPEGYFAYGTGSPHDDSADSVFPMLRSADLIEWEYVGKALIHPAGLEEMHYWAPEVAQSGGRYFLYYSAGGDEGQSHRLRIAIADKPQGPFIDQGKELLPHEPFTIDASPFRDPGSGEWYLFFAKDFFDSGFPGTGVAAAKLGEDLLATNDDPVTLLRPSADWQLFERDRNWYGRIWPAWFTVEGPFCVSRNDRYWLFFSGGLWKGQDYGVGIAVADDVLGPYTQVGEGPTVLKSSPGLRGPGHNSIVAGPDGVDHICFHAWDEGYSKRQMYIEPLEWDEQGPRILSAR